MSTATPLTIREAVAADVPALSRLLSQLGYPTPQGLVAARLSSIARERQTLVLIAEAGRRALGFLALTRMDILPYAGPLARITALCVEEGGRGAGVGSALEERAAEIARGWGCDKLEVTSNRSRVRAHDFYARRGYEETHRCFVKRLRSEECGGGAGAPG